MQFTLRCIQYGDKYFCKTINMVQQEGLEVASIARDDPSTLPGGDTFPRARGKLGSEFET